MTRMPIPLDGRPVHPRRWSLSPDTAVMAALCTFTAGLFAGAILTSIILLKLKT